jgi:hypothetical protein
MNKIFETSFFVVGGNGAVVRHKGVKALQGPKYGPKNNTDPMVRFNKKEREEFYLLKHYDNRPFDFMSDYYKFVVKYKSRFYVNIYNILHSQLVNKYRNKNKDNIKFKVNYNNTNIYDNLKEECLDKFNFNYSVKDDLDFSFKNDSYLDKKRSRKEKQKLFTQLIKLCKNVNNNKQIRLVNLVLKEKIKDKIYLLRINRVNKNVRVKMLDRYLYKNHLKNTIKNFIDNQNLNLEPQMDQQASAHGEGECPKVISLNNTLNEAQRESSQGKPAQRVPRRRKRYQKLASAESSPDYSQLTDRYFPHSVYTWNSIDTVGTKLVDLTLPLDFITAHPNSPNCVLFSNYTYWEGDMEIKLMVNSNKFQIGQLQMAWYYGQDYEKNFDRRDTVWSASQQAHCLISASSSNEGILFIPFRYYKPNMGTKTRKDDPGRLNMGRLTVRVLNQLRSPSTVYKACNFTLSFRFVNSRFSGMIARDLGSLRLEPNMMDSVVEGAKQLLGKKSTNTLVQAALSLLDEEGVDPERDNPVDIRPPMHMVPWSAHSWSIGDKCPEPSNPLRLLATGQTPHPPEVVPMMDEMTVSYISNVFGLVKTIQWNANQRQGELLFSLPGCPQFDNFQYNKQLFDDSVCYHMPPVAVLANLFAYWRGSLELRLDVIASPFHTGRIIIAYIPRVLETPTLEQIKGSPHAIFDLQGESRQFAFKIPFIADRPWWPTRNFSANILPPSYVYCMVLNELVPMDSVVNEVDINIYFRGCSDFELSVPTTPRIGLSTYNATYIAPKNILASTKAGYTPMFVGSWRYVNGGKQYVLRYSNVTDEVVQFNNLKKNTIYVPDDNKNGFKIRGKNNVTEWAIIGANVDCDEKYCPYALYFGSPGEAQNFLDKGIYIEYANDSGYFDKENGEVVNTVIYFKEFTGEFELVPQMDERQEVTATCEEGMLPLVSGTASGGFTFGEDFSHLKTLCRRYQLYTQESSMWSQSDPSEFKYRIPILPQGLPPTKAMLEKSKVLNVQREGPIPIIASGFRFYRGGLRFRFVWTSMFNTIIRIEHHPDERLSSRLEFTEHEQIFNNGYAVVIQDTTLNKVIEFEIPFYQCGVLGYLQNPKINEDLESFHYSLGYLYISFVRTQKTPIPLSFDLYYKLADDCKFYVFQGFPPMMLAPNNHTVNLEPQMFNNIKKTYKNVIEGSERMNSVATKLDNILPSTSKETIDLDESKLEEGKNSLIEWITEHVPAQMKTIMLNFVSQLIHCFINPTIKTICWSLASFLASIGVLCSELLLKFTTGLKKLVTWLQHGAKGIPSPIETKQSGTIRLEAQMDQDKMPDDIKAGLIGTIVASIGAALGCVGRLPKNIPDFTKGCWDNLGKFSLTANHLTTFFKNNLAWIMKAYHWVVRKVFKDKALAAELTESTEEIKEFATECLDLLDENNARKVEVHPKWNMRVYAAASKAGILLMKLSAGESKFKSPALIHLCRRIIELRDKLVKFILSPPVKFEPFVLAFVGETNVGKSHICQSIGKHLLASIEYRSYEELIFTRTPNNQYWNGLRNQPICLYDDFLAIDGEAAMQQAGELFCLKSRSIFNPPQAAIEEKYIRYNPLLVFLAMNDAFPKLASVRCEKAFFRRRDVLVKVTKNLEFYKKHNVSVVDGSPKSFKRSDIKNYEHLLFGIYDSVQEAPQKDIQCNLTYIQLCDILKERFKVFYVNETEQYLESLKSANDFYPDDDDLVTGDMSEIAQKMEENLNNLNRMRYEDIAEFKQFILSNIDNIKSKNDINFKAMKKCINLYSTINKQDADIICKDYSLFSDQLEPQIGTSCPHQYIKSAYGFRRPGYTYDPTKEVPPGVFYDIFSELDDKVVEISEKECDNDDCAFKKDSLRNEILDNWMHHKYDKSREQLYNLCNYDELPFHLIKRRIMELQKESIPQPSFTGNRLNKIKRKIMDELESIFKYCKEVLKTIGSYLYEGLWYALKIIGICSCIFAFVGFARNRMYPERKECKLNQYLVDNNIPYEAAYQGSLGGLDAIHQLNAELLAKEHFSQKMYPELNNDEPQMVASGDYKTFGSTKQNIKDISIKMVANLAKEQEHAILNLIRRNTLFIRAEYDTQILTGRIVGLIDHYALSVDHYHDKFSKLPEDTRFFLVDNRKLRLPIKYSDLVYKKFKDSSLGYYNLPLQVPAFKNLLKHMSRQRDHRHLGPAAVLVETMYEVDSIIQSEFFIKKIESEVIPATNGFEEFVVPDGYSYPKGGRGMCGSLLVSSHLQRPIIGIHVAGDIGGRLGISEAICYETFAFLEDNVNIIDCYEPQMYQQVENFVSPNSCVQVLGAIDPRFAHRESGVSKVIPTECNGKIFEVYCEPPVLSHKDERIASNPFSPMQEGVNKHGLVPTNFPFEYVELAYKDLDRLIKAKVKPIRLSVGKLSKKVAIVGCPEVKGFEKIDFNTSEGFPFVSLRKGTDHSKKWLFDLEQDSQGNYVCNDIDQTLRTVCKLKKQQRLRRELPFTVFTDCLKDRKLPKQKVLIPGKVRIFSISPVDFTIQCRQYFMDFAVSYQEARFQVEHAVGIDVNSIEWTELALKALSRGPFIGTIDYKAYGPSLMAIVAHKAVCIIRNWYKYNGDDSEENDIIREMMGYEQIHSAHLVFKVIYRTLCGLPSGGPLTVILNSLVNSIYIRVAWIDHFNSNINFTDIDIKFENEEQYRKYCENRQIDASLYSFHKHVDITVYGDDVFFALSRDVAPVFNCIHLADSLRKYKIDITNSLKDGQMVKYLSLTDAGTTFLKCNFIPHPTRQGVFLAGLDKASVEDTLNWTFKEWQHKLREISMEASDACIRNAYGNGPQYFNYVREKVFNYWIEQGECLFTPSWEEIDKRNFS